MLWPFIASARTTKASRFWLSQSSRNFNLEQRSARFIMFSIKCFSLKECVGSGLTHVHS